MEFFLTFSCFTKHALCSGIWKYEWRMEITQKDLVLSESLFALWMHMGNFSPISITYNMYIIAMDIFGLFLLK